MGLTLRLKVGCARKHVTLQYCTCNTASWKVGICSKVIYFSIDKHIKGVNFQKVGISNKSGVINGLKMKTLKQILKEKKHENSTIFYLKVDVEGAERDSFLQWISGMFN